MKIIKNILSLLLIIYMSQTTNLYSQNEIIFFDDFSTNTVDGNWTDVGLIQGPWTSTNHGVYYDESMKAMKLISNSGWGVYGFLKNDIKLFKKYSISADFMATHHYHADCGILINYVDDNNYIRVYFSYANAGKIAVQKDINDIETTIFIDSIQIYLNKYYNIKIERLNNEYSFYIDDSLYSTFSVNDEIFNDSTQFGTLAYGNTSSYPFYVDNFMVKKISSLGIPTQFKILNIKDVPNDQGRQVRIKWAAHSDDKADSSISNPITYYSIWRKHDPNLTIHKASSTPDGEWDFITKVPAIQDQNYSVIVPTLADSNKVNGQYYSTFFVRAHSNDPTIHWETDPDSGYSIDNLSPIAVSGLNAELDGNSIKLSWNKNPESDLSYYAIYRDSISNFIPNSIQDAIAYVTSPEFKDANINDDLKYHYRVSAVDFNGNEGELSEEIIVNLTSIKSTFKPMVFKLYQNYPNPFNPTTTIRFSIPQTMNIQLMIYNSNGKLVRKLVQGILPRGFHSFVWDGKNDKNIWVGSGVYFAVLKSKNKQFTTKMLLIK